MADPLLIAKGESDLFLLPKMANRHGLIAGATGTGKTVTLQVIAERLSKIGVAVFMADVKGDLSGISQEGGGNPKVAERIKQLGLGTYAFEGSPVTFWDVFGEQGHPVRATVSEMGPLLFSRLLNLNETQTGVLNMVFKIADDNGLLLLDLKDLRAMLQYVGDNASDFKTRYGNVSAASIGSIQRGLLELESQGGEKFFGEPALNLDDMIQTDGKGHGVVNILAADKLLLMPKTYAMFLLWILSELYENMPEVGDVDKPKLVFFFDEAHLLFNDCPKALVEKIEQVVRLVRSKGVGVFFITQNPLDVPDVVLNQLGNRVQHALRAFSPREREVVKSVAAIFADRDEKPIQEKEIYDLGIGEAIVSFLDEKGAPSDAKRAFILPPYSQIGPITPDQRQSLIKNSIIAGVYENAVDRESAYEKLIARHQQEKQEAEAERQEEAKAQVKGRQTDSMFEAVAKSTLRAVGSQVGRQLVRGILGGLLGGAGVRATRRRRY